MGMIEQETCAEIWGCYREIETAEKLLKDMAELKEDRHSYSHERCLKDAFGKGRKLQLGIPSGEDGHRLFGVSYSLADAVIKSHISIKKAELIELNEKAKLELNR